MHILRTLSVAAGGLLLSHAVLAANLDKKDTEYLQKTAQGTMAEV
jgi:hypothetical protein